jgi:ubiquinone/menaquinone biosynthesis C-methylase UbiE
MMIDVLKAAFVLLLLVLALPVAAQDQDGYTYSTPQHFGTGKAFMGRPIANVVDIDGADWFDRPERAQEEATGKLIPMLQLRPTDVIADIGAGTGYFSFLQSKALPRSTIYAEDIQQGMLDRIDARKARGEGSNVIAVLGTATDPKLPPNAIDLILLVDVWHEMQFPREMAQAMMRALKPGGRIAMVEYRGEDPDVNAANLHKMTEVEARREMAALGFEWVSTDSTTLPVHHLMIFKKHA